MLIGNEPLVTTRGTQLEDFQLKNWIDQTVEAFQEQIQWDIYPRLWRHRPLPNEKGRFDISPSGQIENFAEWDDLYDYDSTASDYFLVQLRRKPICRLLKWELTFPWTGASLIDLMDKAVPKYKSGQLRAVFVRTPWSNLSPPVMGIQSWRNVSGMGSYPGAYKIDYVTGYDHASRVPSELKNIILKYFLICLLSSFGEGIISGVASFSTSVGVISESLTTTSSAENSIYSGFIRVLKEEIKDWWKDNKHKYTQIRLGALG